MNFSIHALVSKLASLGSERFNAIESSPIDNKPTSIRFEPDIRRFIKAQADAFGTSEQSVINIMLKGIMEMSTDPIKGELRAIRDRFVYIFDAHGLDLPSTVSVLADFGFTLSVLNDSDRTLDKITPRVIQFVSTLFDVRQTWLQGKTNAVIELNSNYRWYKNVHEMCRRLIRYSEEGLKPNVMFINSTDADFEAAFKDNDNTGAKAEPIGVIIRLTRKTPDGLEFKTFECWEFERWNYWRCREQIKLLICFCDQASSRHLLSYGGYSLKPNSIQGLNSNMALPVIVIKEIHQVTWHPEDYASIRFKVTEEIQEWDTIKKAYENSRLDRLIKIEGMENCVNEEH
jgi:hypothetical protein